MESEERSGPSAFHCQACGAQLGHDQRYCVACGARRGALPGAIAAVIGGIFERGRGAPAAGQAEAIEQPAGYPQWFDAWTRTPRAAAAAVIGMLGFGALVGSLVGGGLANPLQTLLLAVAPSIQQASSAVGAAGNSQDSGGGGGPQTITVQDAAPSAAAAVPDLGLLGGGFSLSGGAAAPAPPPAAPSNLPPIKHVFLIMLSDQGFQQTFGHSANDPYLATTLVARGELIPGYYAVAGGDLANEIALVSGQGPTPQTVNNCPVYQNIAPANKGAKQQVLGHGCVYPKSTQSLASQLAAAKRTWKVYAQTEASPQAARAARAETCAPKPGSRASAHPKAKYPYSSWRNPFLYFRGLTESSGCPASNVDLGQLKTDLKKPSTTPSLAYIVPDACDDASGLICNLHGPSGLAASEEFLKTVVPEIQKSPAYKADGLIAITFDEAPQTGVIADHSSCCVAPTYPNLPPPPPASTTTSPAPAGGTTSPTSTSPATSVPGSTSPGGISPGLGGGQTSPTGGGGQVGLLLLSRYVKPGLQDVTDYFNHFSLLASIEDLFSLKRLGYAYGFNVPVFGAAVFDAYVPGA